MNELSQKQKANSFSELVEQNAGLSYEKQLLFGEVIGDHSWELAMQEGSISFGELIFPIQIIGSVAFNDSSWMWGWANEQSGISQNLLVQSNKLKELGVEHNIKELTERVLSVTEGFEHKMGMMACGIFKSNSYYCANYGHGTLVVTIDDDRLPIIDKEKIEKVLTHFPQLIDSGMDLNHKTTLINYLIDRDFIVQVSENKVLGKRRGSSIEANFDELERLIGINGDIKREKVK